MWVEIEVTSKFTFRGRTVGDGDAFVGCMLVVTDTDTGELLSSQFVLGITAEMFEAGW